MRKTLISAAVLICCAGIGVVVAVPGIGKTPAPPVGTRSDVVSIDTQQPTKLALQWIRADGKACSAACDTAKTLPLASGTYKNGNPFFICRTNAGDEGTRAGYNLQPAWADRCWVGWGGTEGSYAKYECLCARP